MLDSYILNDYGWYNMIYTTVKEEAKKNYEALGNSLNKHIENKNIGEAGALALFEVIIQSPKIKRLKLCKF